MDINAIAFIPPLYAIFSLILTQYTYYRVLKQEIPNAIIVS